MTTLTLPYPPSANRIWRTAKGYQYTPKEVMHWKQTAWTIAHKAGVTQSTGDVHVEIKLHPRLTKKGTAAKRRIDLDNAIKATLDALNGIAWRDDKQVVRIVAELGEAKEHGGLTVSI